MFPNRSALLKDEASELYLDDDPMPRASSHLDGQERRMLLIEDQLSDVMLAEEMLEQCMSDYGWRVFDKPNMANALKIVNEIKFDVALVDLTLPDMQGAQVIQMLRQAAPDLPIVIYSGSSNLDLLREALACGAQFCIEKGTTMPRVVRAMIQCALAAEPHY